MSGTGRCHWSISIVGDSEEQVVAEHSYDSTTSKNEVIAEFIKHMKHWLKVSDTIKLRGEVSCN